MINKLRVPIHIGRVSVAAAAVAACLAAAPSSQAASGFTYGQGRGGDIAVDAGGTAHVAWNDDSRDPDAVLYCRIPRGASACTGTQILNQASKLGQAYVLIPAPGQVLVVLGAPVCEGGGATCTAVRRSFDGGETFGPVQYITGGSSTRSPYGGDIAYGPGDSISYSTSSSSGSLHFVNAALGGGQQTDGAVLLRSQPHSSSVGLAGGAPVVVWQDQADALWWRTGAGDLNDEGNWTAAQRIDSANAHHVVLAGGPSGLFVMYGRVSGGDIQFFVRKFTGSGWGEAVAVSRAGRLSFGSHAFDMHQDASGRLHVVFFDYDAEPNPNALQWRTSEDGVAWSPTVAVYKQGRVSPRIEVAAAGDGQGFAIWDSGDGPSGLLHNLRAASLEPVDGGEGRKRTTDPCQPPGCESAGGRPTRTVGGHRISTSVEIPSCRTRKVILRLRIKKRARAGRTVVKVKRVVFRLDGQRPKTDRKPPYKVSFSLRQHGLPGSLHRVRAKVVYTIKKPGSRKRTRKLTLTKRFRLCPLA